MRIGFFDSGIGGLTVLHQALRFLPNEDYIYYADTWHVPYGDKPKEEVKGYIFEAVDFIVKQGVKALVIACNTATSIAVEDLRKTYDFPILGIEPAVKPAVQSCEPKHKKVLVLATPLTLKEEKFHNLVKRLGQDDLIDSLPMPGLVHLAENFQFDDEVVLPYLKEKLAPFDINQYGTVVLGCTHFPFFKNSIKRLFPDDVEIISGSVGTAKNLERHLEARNLLGNGTGNVIYYQSGIKVDDPATLTKYKELLHKLDYN
ncbi:glutamate racemase [Pullulanibacillus sp. KACC 23026]|uniref:glutamate racemase n=1 Tax=Pullulanibacillus sp. KACC 23026 TaxID=3028315 RepID=UPI0023B088E4|nr:glutamate racemase [Pullulanibacillus sp. KACC 23026]WEG13554.1 glutamate racemase [Pullulanibacillus sp. KACC 23026]